MNYGTNFNMPHGPSYAGGLLKGAITRLENAVRFHRPETGNALQSALSYYFAIEREAMETRDTQPTSPEWEVWLGDTLRNTQKLVRKARTLLITGIK